MTRRLPNFFWHKYCCPHAIHIFTFNDKFLPKILLNIVSQFNTHGTVIKNTSQATIDFRALKDKSPSFTKRNYFFHFTIICHVEEINTIIYYCTTLSSPILKPGSPEKSEREAPPKRLGVC